MSEILLKSVGVLELHEYDQATVDVSALAVQFLFHPVRFDADATLRDAFLVLRDNPMLMRMFQQTILKNLIDRVFLDFKTISYDEAHERKPGEYLELSREYLLDSSDQPITPLRTLRFDEVGGVLVEPLKVGQNIVPAGQRPRWSAAFSDPCRILDLPLRFANSSSLCSEARKIASKYTESEITFFALPTLGQVLHTILDEYDTTWNLLFGPKNRATS